MPILSRSSDKLWALPLLNNSKTTAFIRLNQEKPTLGIKQPLNKMTMKLTPTTKHLSASKRAADSLFLLFALFAVTAMATPLPEASLSAVIYVDKDAAGANNGSSWGDAYTELADAIKNHSSGEVWVAAGTYKPLYDLTGSATPADPRDKTFFLKNNMAVYGGFSGSETAIAQRNITANPTILSGDIGVAGNTADNAYHVVWARNVNNTAVLDGFTVSQGRANGAFATHRFAGGGILLGEFNQLVQPNAVIRNCTLSNNFAARGGAIAIYGSSGVVSPLIENCTFASNSCSDFGAAILFGAFTSTTVMTPQIINCSFIQNTSQNVNLPTALHLGAQNNATISPSFQSCKFVGNSRIYLEAFSGTSTTVSPVFENCIFSSNGEIRTFASSAVVSPIFRSSSFYLTSFNMSGSVSNPSFTNVIIWGGTITNSTAASISYSLIPNASCPPIQHFLDSNISDEFDLPEEVQELMRQHAQQALANRTPKSWDDIQADIINRYANLPPETEAYYRAIADVMAGCLRLDNPACVESGLHGLGHMVPFLPNLATPLIDDFLNNNTKNLPAALIQYAHSARSGVIE